MAKHPEETPDEPRRRPSADLLERFVLLIGRLPEPLLQAQAPWVGSLLARGGRGRRVRQHLAFAYGEALSPAGRDQLSVAVCRHIARLAAESAGLFRATPEEVERRVLVPRAPALAPALAQGKGLIIVSGHLGNWEWSLAALARLGPVSVVVNEVGRGPLNRRVQQARQALGVELLPAGDARGCLAALRAGRILVLLADRRVRRGPAVCVPFFGQPASCVPGPARLALASEAPVMIGGARRLPDGRFLLDGETSVELIRTGDRRRDVALNTARQQYTIERAIRAQPDQWLWDRRRWLLRRDEPGEDYQALLELLPEYVPEIAPIRGWRRWDPKRPG